MERVCFANIGPHGGQHQRARRGTDTYLPWFWQPDYPVSGQGPGSTVSLGPVNFLTWPFGVA